MVPGFNHTVKRCGKAYHVQTEDLGPANAVVVTHLFSGGNVVASARTSYGDLVATEDLAQRVRALMEEQHKQMLRNLVNGTYDNVDRSATAYQPGELAVEVAEHVDV